MKNLIRYSLFIMLLVSARFTYAQADYEDVVYLKNGSILRGIIIEQVPNESIKLQTRDGNLLVYKFEDILKLTREPVYGSSGKTKQGISNYFGAKGGINMADWAWVYLGNVKAFAPRFQFAVAYCHRFGKSNIYIQPEIQYSRQGVYAEDNFKYSYSSSNYSNNIDKTYKTDMITEYINVPINIKFDFGHGSTKFFIIGGPYLGYWINATAIQTTTDNITGISQTKESPIPSSAWPYYNRFEFGAICGIGISHTLSNKNVLFIDSRCHFALTNLYSNYRGTDNPHNIYFGFSLGYLFAFK